MNYLKHYEALINRAKHRLLPQTTYHEVHHIIPRCLGGSDSVENLVKLTPEEHYTAHLLLIKIYPDDHSLIFAASMMTVNRCNNKRYGWLKRKHSEAMQKAQLGDKNSQFGTAWMHHLEQKISIKVPKTEIDSRILSGWKIGRIIDFSKLKECVICGSMFHKKKKTCSVSCLRKYQSDIQQHKRPLYGREQEFLDLYKSSKSINKALKSMGFSGNNSNWGEHARHLIAELAQR